MHLMELLKNITFCAINYLSLSLHIYTYTHERLYSLKWVSCLIDDDNEIAQERVKNGLRRRKQGEGEKFSSLASSRTVTALHRNVPYCCMVCTVPNSSDRCHKVTEPSYVQTSVYSESPFPSFTSAFLFFLFPILLRFHWKTKSNNQRYNMNFSNQP